MTPIFGYATVLQWVDFVMVPFWLFVIYTGAIVARVTRYKTDPARMFFIPALTLKLVGGIMLGLIYQYYYQGGDTINYFRTARAIVNTFLDSPMDGLKLLTVDFTKMDPEMTLIAMRHAYDNVYWGDSFAYNVSRFVFFTNLLAFNSYYASSLLLSTVSFIGVWGMYRVLYYNYQQLKWELAISVFFIPSVFLWGSGILKDPITIGMLGLLTYGFYRFFQSNFTSLVGLGLAIPSGYVIYSIKPYILLSYVPFVAIWLGLEVKGKVKNALLRFAITPFLIGVSIIGGVNALNIIGQGVSRYSIDNILSTAVTVKGDLNQSYYYEDKRGSSYNIGSFDDSYTSIIPLAPTAIITTYFRPFLWEVRNPLMFLASLESLMLLILTLATFYRTGIWLFFTLLFRNPFFLFCFGYSISFAFMVGLTSGNFGNLVRYKIPCIPFYVAGLFMMRYHAIQVRREVAERIRKRLQSTF